MSSATNAADPRRIQTRGSTRHNRYPKTFAAAERLARLTCPNGARILSFGCSTGEECVTLAGAYFAHHNDRVFGVDVDGAAVRIAQSGRPHDRVRYFESGDVCLDVAGPFDVIFAMSVLCVWPETRDLVDISAIFPFERFVATCTELDQRLKVGGLLVIHNANYRLMQTPLKRRYQPVTVRERDSALVHQFDSKGRRHERRSNQRIFRKLA